MRFLSDLCKGEKEQNEIKCLTEVTNGFFTVFIKQGKADKRMRKTKIKE